jgi:hypothetical protein
MNRYDWIEFYEMQGEKKVMTDARPGEKFLVNETYAFEQRMKKAYPQFPGNMEPHLVPGKLRIIRKDAYTWSSEYPASTGAVLAHAADLCAIYEHSLPTLWREAYPGEVMPEVNHAGCGRPAYAEDFYKVTHDLAGANLGVLGMIMEKRIMQKGG